MVDITITPHQGTVRVFWRDMEVATSDRALALKEGNAEPVFYVPRTDVEASLLGRSAKRTRCPHKGDASYFDLRSNGEVEPEVAWSYETPLEAVAAIGGHLAFFRSRVRIET